VQQAQCIKIITEIVVKMKSNALKSGLIFGIIMTIGLITSYSIIEGEINLKIIVSRIIGSAVGGLIFGLFMKNIFNRGNKIQVELQENETIIKEGFANHKLKFESVGGKLFLTTKRLIFKSHKINIQKHIFELELNNISNCDRYKTMGIFSNGMKITKDNKTIEKFVVNSPDEWIENMKKIKNTTE